MIMEKDYLVKDMTLDFSKKNPYNLGPYETWMKVSDVLHHMETPKRDSDGILINFLPELKEHNEFFYFVKKHPNVLVGRTDNGSLTQMRFISKEKGLEKRIEKLLENEWALIKENIQLE